MSRRLARLFLNIKLPNTLAGEMGAIVPLAQRIKGGQLELNKFGKKSAIVQSFNPNLR